MPIPIQSRFSPEENRRPVPTTLIPGELAVSTHTNTPGLYFRDSANNLVKVGPTYIGATAPVPTNHAVLLRGEMWWNGDTLRLWNGIQWEIINSTSPEAILPLNIPEVQMTPAPVGLLTGVSFSTGRITVLSGSSRLTIQNPSVSLKNMNAWQSGNGGGRLGTLDFSTWYHAFCIYNITTDTVDFVFSSSLTPTLPEGFTYRRRVGSVLVNSSGFMVNFSQRGASFQWDTPFRDLNRVLIPAYATGPDFGGRNYRLSVPTGISVEVKGSLDPGVAALGETLKVEVISSVQTVPSNVNTLPSIASNVRQLSDVDSNSIGVTAPSWITNTNAQLNFSSSGAYRNGIGSTNFTTYGWTDLGLALGI